MGLRLEKVTLRIRGNGDNPQAADEVIWDGDYYDVDGVEVVPVWDTVLDNCRLPTVEEILDRAKRKKRQELKLETLNRANGIYADAFTDTDQLRMAKDYVTDMTNPRNRLLNIVTIYDDFTTIRGVINGHTTVADVEGVDVTVGWSPLL